ncbi:MAG: hypothetical protein DI533_04670 [Cereibacter sphaeroides]|uniref:Uncharacterized protein n=1 Tax=Cereibacter sphaeroides TaxID=1063 RepID=A0A2W5SA85_CERSP|nr:MAG: hypothetical protein DI533_04670 [Cereibacter sphaeroides]
MNKWIRKFGPVWAPDDGGGTGAAAAAADPPPGDAAAIAAAAAAAAAAAPAAKWWEASDYSTEEREWAKARGLTDDDPLKVLPKLVKGHRNAEQRLGRGVESILDKPAEGQKLPEWMAANRAALGLPDKEDAYAIKPPDFWPKDEAWDGDLATKAQKIAFEKGIAPEVLADLTALYAGKMKGMIDASKNDLAAAQAQMMTELRTEFGAQTETVITRARQATEVVAQKAGLTSDHVMALNQVLSDKTGDATVIRFMAAIGEMLGEDSLVGGGKGGALTMTPADARAAFATFTASGSEWTKAIAEGNNSKIREMKPQYETLAKLATQKAS